MGAEIHLAGDDAGALSPLALWAGILAGPIAWASDLCVSYALVQWTCVSQRTAVLHLLTCGALAVVAAGVMLSWAAWRHTSSDRRTDGGHPRQRAHFMAVLGLLSSALFTLAIVATAIPRWVLDACH